MSSILITGASGGIGIATALELANDYDNVFLHYHKSRPKVIRGFEDRTPIKEVKADLSKHDGYELLYDQVFNEVDHLDVLINNAGDLIKRQNIEDYDSNHVHEMFTLNAISAMMLTSKCVGLLKRGTSPCVINITSVAIRHGAPSATIYAATKGALDVFTRGAAKELAPKIRVNAIAPGVIETPLHERVSSPEKMEEFRNNTPLKTNGTPEQVAKAARFLIENKFMTGETLDINGGIWMR